MPAYISLFHSQPAFADLFSYTTYGILFDASAMNRLSFAKVRDTTGTKLETLTPATQLPTSVSSSRDDS